MLSGLHKLLEVLEDQLDYSSQQKVIECHRRSLAWEETDRLPLVLTYPYPEKAPFQPFPYSEAYANPEKMLYNELVHAFDTSILLHSSVKDDLPYTIRANFGTVVIASLLGGRVEQISNNPPWVRSFDSEKDFLNIFNENIIDYSEGIAKKLIDTYRIYHDILAGYPNLKRCLNIVLPDLQGPLDTLDLLKGSSVFADFLLNPELVEKSLALIANTQIDFAKALNPYISSNQTGFSFQHGVLIKGNILIRNDSTIMISPDIYREQVAPYDETVLKAMGGGGIHACGKIDHNLPEILKLPSITCFDFGQSYMNDLENAYTLASERKIPLIRIRLTRELLLSAELKKQFPTGVSLVYDASSYEEACHVSGEYKRMYN